MLSAQAQHGSACTWLSLPVSQIIIRGSLTNQLEIQAKGVLTHAEQHSFANYNAHDVVEQRDACKPQPSHVTSCTHSSIGTSHQQPTKPSDRAGTRKRQTLMLRAKAWSPDRVSLL
jgi:hypothetical protein